MEKENNVITIKRSTLKKVMVGSAVVGALLATAIPAGVSFGKDCYQRFKGSDAITKEVNESGLIPNGLSHRDDSQAGEIWEYQDAYGNSQRILDIESFFNDIAAESYDFGFTPDQMAVAFDFGYGYDGEILGATEAGMTQAKLDAYNELQKNMGVSR